MKNKSIVLVTLMLACSHPVARDEPAPLPNPSAAPPPALRTLKITSECADPIWIQQENHAGAPALTKLTKGTSTLFSIPDEGLPSTRYWAKTGCDATGNSCAVGQSSPPCPAAGCAPPVDSKLEATWGCTLPEAQKEQCAKTDQGPHVKNTWWNASAVDGFTLPFLVAVSGASSDACAPVNCAMLDQNKCPASEALPPAYPGGVDLRVQGGGGCFSPCAALTYPAFGGKGIQPPSDPRAAAYCCPPPVSSAQCSSGPAATTKYVEAIHKMCADTTYGYAYDDALGLRQCDPTVELQLIFCPGIPAVATP